MKTQTRILMRSAFAALLLAVTPTLPAQEARYFRISGPVVATITEFRPDGTLVWTNTPTNTTFTVQTATALRGETNWIDYVQIPATNGVTTNRLVDFHPPVGMALIPGGSFTMGSDEYPPDWGEQPMRAVHVSAFYMDRYEVTKARWDEVYNWALTNGYHFEYGAEGKASNHPAENLTWYDAVKWCNARSEKEGLSPTYYTDATQTVVYRTGSLDVASSWVKWNAGYRLPTEAEWEKAARGGLSGRRFPWGNTISWTQANYYADPALAYDVNPTPGAHPTFSDGGDPLTSPVGYFAPNGYGLYDMAGNVWEWCWDWYSSSYYSSAPNNNPHNDTPSSDRVIRGGSWGNAALDCRSVMRGTSGPAGRNYFMGFRSIRPLGQ